MSSEVVRQVVSRRTLFRSAGVGAAAVAVTGAGSLTRGAQASTSESPLAAVTDYLASRAAAGDPGRAATKLASTSADLAKFELERARYMRSLGQRFDWNGRITGLASTPATVDVVSSDASHAVVRVYEVVTIDWVPNPRPMSNEFRSLREAEPERYGLHARPGQSVRSAIGTEHELRVERSTSGWSVVADAYAEPDLFGNSPDVAGSTYIRGLSETLNKQPPSTQVTTADAPNSQAATAASGSYDWIAAGNYAQNHALSYNANYAVYNNCGGDCANFVSQCFYAGAEITDGTWYRYTGSACGYSNRWCGTTTWVNNWSLRNWVINAGRGAATTLSGTGAGDIINYDWTQNGTYDHVTIMTDPPNQLVCSHNVDRLNVPWQLGDTSANHKFTRLYAYY